MMNEKEVGELRRRLKIDKCAVDNVYGCFVSDKKEIVSTFRLSLGMMGKDDSDALLTVMRKVFSGKIGRNLIDLAFTNEQVMDSGEHRLFMDLRKGGEEGEPAVTAFFEKTAETLVMEGSYIILLALDSYDVPAFGRDGERAEESENVFNYCLCAVCPVKETKPALGFFANESAFRQLGIDRVLGAPEIGFMFPSFEDRCANIYNMLYYSKRTDMNHPEFIEEVVRVQAPSPADEQKEAFNDLLKETLSEDCSLDVAVAVRDTICEKVEEYKADGGEEMPAVTKKTVTDVLEQCGVAPEKVTAFSEKYDERFGAAAEFAPDTVVDTGAIAVETPDVSIKISSDRSDLIETRVIDGIRYILIRAESSVEVNGVSVNIK